VTTRVTFDVSKLGDALTRAVNDGLAAAANVAADEAVRSFGKNGEASSPPGSPPNWHSGKLGNSISYAHPDRLGTPLHAAFGTEVPYGKYLETGATVRPKRTKYLPVPINDAAKRMARQVGNQGVSLRTKNLKVIIDKAKRQALLVEQTKTGKQRKNGAVFVLKRSVTIKARPWIMRAAKSAPDAMLAAFKAAARNSLQASGT